MYVGLPLAGHHEYGGHQPWSPRDRWLAARHRPAAQTVHEARKQVRDILNGQDHRLIVVVGPCSIHDTKAAREYAGLLNQARHELSRRLAHSDARPPREAPHRHWVEGAGQ